MAITRTHSAAGAKAEKVEHHKRAVDKARVILDPIARGWTPPITVWNDFQLRRLAALLQGPSSPEWDTANFLDVKEAPVPDVTMCVEGAQALLQWRSAPGAEEYVVSEVTGNEVCSVAHIPTTTRAGYITWKSQPFPDGTVKTYQVTARRCEAMSPARPFTATITNAAQGLSVSSPTGTSAGVCLSSPAKAISMTGSKATVEEVLQAIRAMLHARISIRRLNGVSVARNSGWSYECSKEKRTAELLEGRVRAPINSGNMWMPRRR